MKSSEDSFIVNGNKVVITGSVVRMARLHDEYYVYLNDPKAFLRQLRQSGTKAAIFTFLEDLTEKIAHHDFYWEKQSIALLPITTYDDWFQNQIRFKARNKVHKAAKTGVEVRSIPFDDNLIRGIAEIYNESPVRQGKRFQHYGKDLATIKRDHETFIDRSEFVGAFYKDELIGFIKFVEGKNVASLMQIISKISHRDKAPTNALLARAVKLCSEKKIGYLHYGIWGGGGLSVFKASQGFLRYEIPRYYVPLNFTGRVFLKVGMHRNLRDHVPQTWVEELAALRRKWAAFDWAKLRSVKSVN